MFLISKIRILLDKIILKDWMIALAGLLTVKECVVVSASLSQLSQPIGLVASIAFICISGFMFAQLYQKIGRKRRAMCFVVTGLLATLLFTNGGVANAQFLQNAETFFTAGATQFNLGTSIDLLIGLIFWIIRGAFVIGVAIALLPAIQAAREGEEWRTLAKTPMIIVGIVLAGSTSVDFLVGGAGAGAPPVGQ